MYSVAKPVESAAGYASTCTVTLYLILRMRVVESGFIEHHQLGLGTNIEAKINLLQITLPEIGMFIH